MSSHFRRRRAAPRQATSSPSCRRRSRSSRRRRRRSAARSRATIIAAVLLPRWPGRRFGQVDIVASAPGKIIPSGRTKLIQPFETGVVRAIHVRDGQSVKAGDVLIELDPTMNEAEQDHLQSDLVAAQLDVARLRAALERGSEIRATRLSTRRRARAAHQIATQRQFLANQIEEQRAKIAALDRQRAQKEAERDTDRGARSTSSRRRIPFCSSGSTFARLCTTRSSARSSPIWRCCSISSRMQQELAVQKSRPQEADAALAAIIETRARSRGRVSSHAVRRTRRSGTQGRWARAKI